MNKKVNFKTQNDNAREFFKQDFTPINELLLALRKSLSDGTPLECDFVSIDKIIKYNPNLTFMYVTLFEEGNKLIRFGSKRATLRETLERIVSMLRKNKSFENFHI